MRFRGRMRKLVSGLQASRYSQVARGQVRVPDEKIGIYVLQEQIGKGGMGAVYLAHDPTLQRPVAIKILPAELAADPDYVARFEREATSLAKLRHPNLMHIYAVGCDQGRHFIAMEYVRGSTLARVVRKQGPLHYKVAIRVLGQVLSALDKVHAAGMVHRDLKSSNIMIDEDKRAILMDFGLAKPRHDRSVTTGHTLIGTPEYMAPELAEGKDAEFRTDIYALGIVLYEMLTGQVPYRGSSAIATLRQQVESPTPSLVGIVPDLPPRLEAALQKALAKDPGSRYQTVREFAADLAPVHRPPALARLVKTTAPRPTAPTIPVDVDRTESIVRPAGTPATLPAVRRRPAWLLPAIGGACLGVLALAAVFVPRLFSGPNGSGGPEPGTKVAANPPPKTSVPPGTAVSKHRYRILATGNSVMTGRLVAIDPEAGWVRIQAADGTIESIPYSSVLRIEKLEGD